MTLTDVTGIWTEGLTAVNTEEVTENAPCGDDIVFTSSKPETTSGTVTTWGAADWELTNKDTSDDTQTASVTLKGNVEAEPGPTTFTLADDTNYSVRVQYSSADPAAGPSEWSDVNNFKTCSPKGGACGNFSTTLYPGNGGTQSVETGVDNTTKSMVWIKNRNDTKSHQVFDTNRGPGNVIHTNDSVQAADDIETLSSFSSNGFTVGTRTGVNAQNNNYVAWNFAAAAGFFDIIEFQGNGGSVTKTHDLGVEPAFVITKAIDDTGNWGCYHKDLVQTQKIVGLS